ncbi:MAG: WGxxGxxG family protein [Gaiellaceae bacterium]
MRKRFAVLLAASALGVGAASPVAFAGTGTDAVTEDDGGTDYGWIGLLGLAGLAGLMGRKRDDRVDVRRDDAGSTTRR